MESILADLKSFNKQELSTLYRYYNVDSLDKLAKKIWTRGVIRRRGKIEPGVTIFDAISENNVELVKEFLSQPNFNVNQQNNDGVTPLLLASVNDSATEITKLLLENGADPNIFIPNANDPLINMITLSYPVSIIRLMIDKGADINHVDVSGLTPLQTALREENTDIAKLLIEQGANLDEKSGTGTPTLIFALNNPEILELMLKKGVNVNATMSDGKTALFSSKTPSIKLLLEYKADPNITDNGKRTPLIAFSSIGNLDIVKLLIENNANINAKTLKGNSALTSAIIRDHKNVAEYLIENGADIDNKGGENPLMIANNNNYYEIIRILLDAGAKITDGLLVAIKMKARDIKMLLNHTLQFLNKQEKEFFNASNIGEKCLLKEIKTVKELNDLEKCLETATDMVKYKGGSKGLEKLERKYETHPYFSKKGS